MRLEVDSSGIFRSEYLKGFIAAGLKSCFETTPSTLQWPVRSMRSPTLTVQVTRCSELLVLYKATYFSRLTQKRHSLAQSCVT